MFELPGHPDRVLKEFKPGTAATQASNEADNLDALRRVFGVGMWCRPWRHPGGLLPVNPWFCSNRKSPWSSVVRIKRLSR